MFLNAGLLYCTDDKGYITVYDISEKQIIAIFKAQSAIKSLMLSSDSQYLYTYSQNCKLYKILIESSEYKEIREIQNACSIISKNNDYEDEEDDASDKKSISLFKSTIKTPEDDEMKFKKMKSFFIGKRDGSICKINTNDYS